MISDFNQKYEYVLNSNYNFLLENKNIFALQENYLLHIRNRINIENNVQYHQDISVIFELMNRKNRIINYTNYLLHSDNTSNMFSITNDNVVNDFINKNISLEDLIENKLFKINL